MKSVVYLFLAGFLLFSCHPGESELKSEQAESNSYAPISGKFKDKQAYETTAEQVNLPQQQGLKLIKSAQLELKSNGIEKSKEFINRILNRYQGYYGDETFDKSAFEAVYRLKIRVPAANFEKFLSDLGNGPMQLVGKNVQTKDVTEEYADTESRIQSKRAYLKRYQELLGKAKNVTELLEMEEQIRQLIEELELAESRLNHLNNHMAFSEISIKLFQEFQAHKTVVEKPGFWSKLADALIAGGHAVQRFIIGLVSIWPTLLFLTIIGFIFRKPLRKGWQAIQGKN